MRDWEQFEKTAREESKADPAAFRRRVFRRGAVAKWAVLGTFALLTCWPFVGFAASAAVSLLGTMKAFGGTCTITVLGLCVVLYYWIRFAKALPQEIEPLEGLVIPDGADEKILSDLDQICARVGAKKIDDILVTELFRSKVEHRRRSRFFGRWRTTLVLGIYELGGLSVDEFRALLTATIATRSGRWAAHRGQLAYAQSIWRKLRQATQPDASDENLMNDPVLILARRMEQELAILDRVLTDQETMQGDDEAAINCGKEAYVRASVKWEVGRMLGDLRRRDWLERLSRAQSVPPPDFVENAIPMYADPPTAAELESATMVLYERAFERDFSNSLPLRIARLGLSVEECLPAIEGVSSEKTKSALEEYFPDHFRAFEAFFSHRFQVNAREFFMERALLRSQEIAELENLDAQLSMGELFPVEHAWLKLTLTSAVQGNVAALEFAPEFLAKFPDAPFVLLEIGRLRLSEGQEIGLEHLKLAMKLQPRLASAAAEALFAYVNERGLIAQRSEVIEALNEARFRIADASGERDDVTPKTEFVSPKLSRYRRGILTKALTNASWVSKAWVATREFENPLNVEIHYLAIVPTVQYTALGKPSEFDSLIREDIFSHRELWGLSVYLLIPGWNCMFLRKRFETLPNAQIFDRKTPFAFK